MPCPSPKIKSNRAIGKILCGEITRSLRTIRNLKGKVYVVGGVVTEGETLRDIDIVITNAEDIPNLKKCLGKFASRAHFILQKGEPPATMFVKVTGKDARSAGLYKGKGKPPKHEYAS